MSGPTTWSHASSSSSTNSTSRMPSSTAPSLTPTTRGIDISGWSIRSTTGPIGSSAEMDSLSDLLGIPPPEMAFPHNSLVLSHPSSGFSLCFDAVRTLRSIDGVLPANRLYGVDCRENPSDAAKGTGTGGMRGAKPKPKGIKVAYAKEWGKSRSDYVDGSTPKDEDGSHFGPGTTTDIPAAKEYDWTYSTTWAGSVGDIAPQPLLPNQATPTLSPGLSPLTPPKKAEGKEWWTPGTDPARDRIPVERLGPSSGEPILFYDDIVLYEDELADNGSSIVNVKVRVMPSGFLVLQRFFLRVDDVLFRVFDTRLYCQFDPSPVPRNPSTATTLPTSLPASLNQLSLGPTRRQKNEEEGETSSYPRLIRECSGSEAAYTLVRSHLPPYKPHDLSPLTDVNWVSQTLTKISQSNVAAYHANVATGTALAHLAGKDASAGAKFLTPATRFPRPGERVDLSPAQAPGGGGNKIVGELDAGAGAGAGGDWQGCGARVDVAVLKPL